MATRTTDMADRVEAVARRIAGLVDSNKEDHRVLGALMRAAEALEPVVEWLEEESSRPKCECGDVATCPVCVCCDFDCEC